MDSVKSTVTVLEKGTFIEEGGGFDWVLFIWRIPLLVEEECVLISRRGSSSSGVGGHIFRWGRGAFESRGGDLPRLE